MTSMVSASARPAVERQVLPPSMVERVTLIMDRFQGSHRRLTLEDVARRTRLPRSTAHRILDQLVRLQWLDHTAFGYGLGDRSLSFRGREGDHGELRAAAASLLHDLAMRTEMVVHLAVLDGVSVYYLDKLGGRSAAAVPSRVGGRAPAHCTALGKAMLARLAPELIDSAYAGGVGRLTPRSIGDLGVLHQELNRIRRRKGLAFEREECVPGLGCVAAAVRGPEGPVGAISLVGNARVSLERVAPLVADAARTVSHELFPDMAQPRRARRLPAATQETWSRESMARFLAVGENGDWL
ncbi:IclR family transcriptional regulator [Pseudonocardia nigra]|uniref:IclR family transcriptional regulator n=1 Tax=Pseudonocardia nigra TaxID=1921578 RepID=UPI001FEA7D5C|nr:IclR family transcriptional regulator [Pseudonocardia nigra]